jgi:hypothetical protein
MSDLASEREIEEYLNYINEKTNSIIEILKGESYTQTQQILKAVQERIERQLNVLILFR